MEGLVEPPREAGGTQTAAPTAPHIIRKFQDLGSAYARELSEDRYYRAGWRDDWRDAKGSRLQPSKKYRRYLLEPHALAASSETFVCSRYCHTALNKSMVNKVRSPVNVARWTPEGRWLITGAQSGEFTLWNGYDFSFNRVIQGHDKAVRAVVWSRSGEWMVSGDQDGFFKVWNPSIRMMAEVQAHSESVRGLCFSPTDAKLGTCSDDVTVRIWDFATRQEEVTMKGHGVDVKSVDWHPTKGLLASGSRDNTIKLWSPREGRCIRTINGHKHTVGVVQFHPKSEDVFLSASRDWTVRLHDLRMLREGSHDTSLLQWKAHDAEIHAAAWHPIASDLLVTGGYDGSMAFWIIGGNSTEPARQAYVPAAHEAAIWDLDWNPLGHMLASGSNDHTAKFWARPKPGDSEIELYRGFQKDISETDAMRSSGAALPISHADREKDRLSRTAETVRRTLADTSIPGIGKIGEECAAKQAGLLLAPPTDTAAAAALALEAALSEQRRAAAQMESGREPDYGAGEHGGSRGIGGDRGGDRGPRRPPLSKLPREAISAEDFPKPRYRGLVKMWNPDKGFGFVQPFDPSLPSSLFTHASCIAPKMGSNAGEGQDTLQEGANVEFSVEEAENRKNGTKQTRAVYVIDKAFFQPGFSGYTEFPANTTSSRPQPQQQQQQQAPPQLLQPQQQQQQWRPDEYNQRGYAAPQPPPPPPSHAQPMYAGGHYPQQPPPQYAPPPAQQLNPEFVATVRRLYEEGQRDYLESQLAATGLSLQAIFPYLYPGRHYPG